jgi:hypothetical protein
MNLQVISAPDGEILWLSGPLTGAIHDLTAARIWAILRELAASGLITLADKGYHGAGEHVLTPYRGRNKPASQKEANSAHAQLRSPGERANAQLKTWHVLRKLRSCPWKAGQIAKAIDVLQTRERSEDEKGSVSDSSLPSDGSAVATRSIALTIAFLTAMRARSCAEPKAGKNRLHLDIVTPGPMEAEVARLADAGAEVVEARLHWTTRTRGQ